MAHAGTPPVIPAKAGIHRTSNSVDELRYVLLDKAVDVALSVFCGSAMDSRFRGNDGYNKTALCEEWV
jgi:hypothetical protein